jgi:hypothetical protein
MTGKPQAQIANSFSTLWSILPTRLTVHVFRAPCGSGTSFGPRSRIAQGTLKCFDEGEDVLQLFVLPD